MKKIFFFLLVSYCAYSQVNDKEPKKNKDKGPDNKQIVFDFATKKIKNPETIKEINYKDFFTIKVENFNPLLYKIQVITEQEDYIIPPSYNIPLQYFVPGKTEDKSAKKDESTPTTVEREANEIKPDSRAKQILDASSEDDIKQLEKAGFNVQDTTKITQVRYLYTSGTYKSLYKKRVENIDRQFSKYQDNKIHIELLKDLNTRLNFACTAENFKTANSRLKTIDSFCKELYANTGKKGEALSSSDTLGRIDSSKVNLNYVLELLYRTFTTDQKMIIDQIAEDLRRYKRAETLEEYMWLVDKEIRDADYKQLEKNLSEIQKDYNETYTKYQSLIVNMRYWYELINKEENFSKTFPPIQVESKDYINVHVKIVPSIENLLITQQIAGDFINFKLPTLEESNFKFRIDTRRSLKFSFSTGFMFNFGPNDKSYSISANTNPANTYTITKLKNNNVLSSFNYGGFVHCYSRLYKDINIGGSFGVSLNSELSDVNIIVGPSVFIGKSERIVITTGLNLSRANTLKSKYMTNRQGNDYIINQNVEADNLVEKQFKAGFALAFTFNLTPSERR